MARNKRRVIGIAAVLVAAAALPPRAWAQTLGNFGRWEQTIEFGVDSNHERIKDPFRHAMLGRTRTDQKVGVRGRTPIFDPRFITTNVSFNVALFQDRLSLDRVRTPIDGRLLGYDLSANVLPEKSIALTLFANQTNGTVSREFAGTSDVATESRGLSLAIKRLRLPSTLMWRTERLEEEARYGNISGRRAEWRDTFTWDGQRSWRAQNLSVRYERTDLENREFSSLSHRATTATVQHRVDLGQARTKSIASSLLYFSRQGDFSSSSLSASEGLLLQHGRSLSTGYHYNFLDYGADNGQTRSHVGLWTLQHQWYESLRTNATARYSAAEFPVGFEHRWTARVDPNYSKRLPGGGTLIVGLAGSYELQTNRLVSGDTPVVQERHTVRIGVPFRLERPQPDVRTIVVSDASGTIVFQENVDYLVRVFGDFAEITVLPEGRIREGQVVSIDYRATAAPLIKFSTKMIHANVAADFGWFYPYVGYERARQDLVSGIDNQFLDDVGTRSAGVQVRWERGKLRATLLNDYRSQNGRRLAFDSLQLGQTIAYSPTPVLALSFSVTEDFSDFRIPRRRTRSALGRSTVGWKPPLRGMYVEAFDALRLWRDSLAPGETFAENGVRITWALGRLNVQTFIGYDLRQRDGNETRALRTMVRVTRRLGAAG